MTRPRRTAGAYALLLASVLVLLGGGGWWLLSAADPVGAPGGDGSAATHVPPRPKPSAAPAPPSAGARLATGVSAGPRMPAVLAVPGAPALPAAPLGGKRLPVLATAEAPGDADSPAEARAALGRLVAALQDESWISVKKTMARRTMTTEELVDLKLRTLAHVEAINAALTDVDEGRGDAVTAHAWIEEAHLDFLETLGAVERGEALLPRAP